MKSFFLAISICLSTQAMAALEFDKTVNERPYFPFFDARIEITRCGSEQGRDGIYNARIVRACMGIEKASGRRILMVRNGTSPIYYYLLHGELPREGESQTMVRRFIAAFPLDAKTLTLPQRRDPFFLTFNSLANVLGRFDNINFSAKMPEGFYAAFELISIRLLPAIQLQFKADGKSGKCAPPLINGSGF
jgi:hypothetical protein